MEFYGIPHRWGKMAVGLNTFCFKLLEKTKRHVWSPTAQVSVQRDLDRPMAAVSCSDSHAAPACLLRALAPRDKGQEEEGERELCCAQFHFINAFYLMALLFSGKA